MKVIVWIFFLLAVVSMALGVLGAVYELPFPIFDLTPGGYLRVSNTLLLFAITLYVIKKM